MAAGYRVFRVDGAILPTPSGGAPPAGAGGGGPGQRPRATGGDLQLAIQHSPDRRGRGADPRGRRARWRLDDRPAPEVRLPRGGGSVQPDRADAAVLRRGSAARRAVPHADPEAAAADDGAARAGRRMGHEGRVQSARRSTRHRLRARIAAERRRHHRDAQDHGGLRHAQGRDRAALHRPDCDGRPSADDDGVSGAGADGVQSGRTARAVPVRVPRVPQRQGVAQRSTGTRRDRRSWRS